MAHYIEEGSSSMSARTRTIWTFVVTSLGLFMVVLDNLVVSTALPVIRTDLGASIEQLEWTVNAYTLTFAVLLLTGAALGDRFGRRRLFVIGLAIFTGASAAAALAPSADWLIAARAVQGIGGAIVTPLSLTILSEAVPRERRGVALGAWSGVAGLAVAAGPLVGGAVVEGISWQWIFWLNVPIGVVLLPLAILRLRESKGPEGALDLPGLALVSAGLFGVVWGLVNGNGDGWTSPAIVAAITGGSVLLAGFVAWERRAAQPMVPLRLFRDRGFSAANGASLFMYFGMFGSIFDRIGGRPLMATGLALQAIALGWLALVSEPSVPYTELVGAFILGGIGMALFFAPVANVVLSAVRPEEEGKASGVNNAIREVGGVLGVAVLASVFSSYGSYVSPQAFTDGLVPAVCVGAAVLAVGAVVSLLIPRKQRPQEAVVGEVVPEAA